ncbi:hypothetical protein PEPS_22440 [Persicobacter psychrovividus]|uniref:Uncharacterized protein n=1 Tax=Persicobacter psychrovividus TaxID=387638 RepID=A0ABN6LAX1_9BACT|nr:hypothetical protein PEPS_22440 [Persicobacter psychrovividus]
MVVVITIESFSPKKPNIIPLKPPSLISNNSLIQLNKNRDKAHKKGKGPVTL